MISEIGGDIKGT